MVRNHKWKFILAAAAMGLFVAMAAPAQSGRAASSSKSFVHVYEISKEVKIEGTIQKIETEGVNAPIGTHVLIQTAQGIVDAHLGSGAAASPSNLGIGAGDEVELVGMMQKVDGNQVLLARLLTTSDHIFVLRNEHGIPARGVAIRGMQGSQTEKGGL
ncbi:MAG TPA: hypothetical protein VJR23_09065 [Candidatus Acidoferrales bacterium]|nr:hypothetical protein [Candidatus Acidoferrales bacterium]